MRRSARVGSCPGDDANTIFAPPRRAVQREVLVIPGSGGVRDRGGVIPLPRLSRSARQPPSPLGCSVALPGGSWGRRALTIQKYTIAPGRVCGNVQGGQVGWVAALAALAALRAQMANMADPV